MQPEGEPRFWYRDNFFLTNDKSYLDSQVFNKFLKQMWWSSPLEQPQLHKLLNNCLTLAVYSVPQTAADMKGGWFKFLWLPLFVHPVLT